MRDLVSIIYFFTGKVNKKLPFCAAPPLFRQKKTGNAPPAFPSPYGAPHPAAGAGCGKKDGRTAVRPQYTDSSRRDFPPHRFSLPASETGARSGKPPPSAPLRLQYSAELYKSFAKAAINLQNFPAAPERSIHDGLFLYPQFSACAKSRREFAWRSLLICMYCDRAMRPSFTRSFLRTSV